MRLCDGVSYENETEEGLQVFAGDERRSWLNMSRTWRKDIVGAG